MTVAPPEDKEATGGRPVAPSGWLGWATSTDHKRIGLLTVATSLVLLLLMGVLALLMRGQLAQPTSTSSTPSPTTRSSPSTAPA